MLTSLGINAQNSTPLTFRNKCFTLYRLLEKHHYKPVQWNDSVSAALFSKLINELDENKLYFTKSDIKLMETFRYHLAVEVTGKEWNFLKTITPLFKLRLWQYDSSAINALSKPFDYKKKESLTWPPVDFAATPVELQIRVQQFFKWNTLNVLADSIIGREENNNALTRNI